jgi:dephospho-CoA kinase
MTLTIGITGRAGSGKTFAQSLIEKQFNVTTIDLDKVGHRLLEKTSVKKNIIKAFGTKILDSSHNISRPALGKIVFSNTEALKTLNLIIHPEIKETVITLIAVSTKPVFIIGALLKEIKLMDLCDSIIALIADETVEDKNSKQYKIAQHQRSVEDYKEESDTYILNSYSNSFNTELLSIVRSLL